MFSLRANAWMGALVLMLVGLALAGCGEGGDSTSLASVGKTVNGEVVFWSSQSGDGEIYRLDTATSSVIALTDNDAWDADPRWSPDGKQIAFMSDRDGNMELYVMEADGSGVRRLTHNPAWDGNPDWSPDGKQIVFVSERDANRELYIMAADGGDPRRLTENIVADWEPAWSPDGERIAFVSSRMGTDNVFVMDAAGGSARQITFSKKGDYAPTWAPDGKQIAFMSKRQDPAGIYTVAVTEDAEADRRTLRRLNQSYAAGSQPAWTTEKDRLVFVYGGNGGILAVMGLDGDVIQRYVAGRSPDWRP